MRSSLSASVVRYVENKAIEFAYARELLAVSARENQWSNFGPLSRQLDEELSRRLGLGPELRVVSCCNATVATHALVAMHETLAGRPLRWASSSFGFYSSVDGNLCSAQIVDCDKNGMLDLNLIDPSRVDGIVVTNMFGQRSELIEYQEFCERHSLRLVADSAMAVHSGKRIPNECISLHHTKPWGFGEGGCAIVHESNEHLFRNLLSFGHEAPGKPINRLAMNGKISEVACAFILAWLQEFDDLKLRYNEQYERIANIGMGLGYNVLANALEHPGIPANVPLLCPIPKCSIEGDGIPLRRYYVPLASTDVANGIYNRIVNVPCHREMERFDDAEIMDRLAKIQSNA